MKKERSRLELEIATIEVMIVSLYNSINDIVKAILPKTNVEKYETWLQKCQDTAARLLEKEVDENE